MRSHTGTVASMASPTTVRRQWFSILRALPLESNTTMREKLGSQRLLNWLPPSREKPPGAGTADFESVVRGAFRSLSGSAVAGVCLPLEPGPLEKRSRARPSDCVYERPDYEWFHWATNGTTLPSVWDHCRNLRQPKTRSQDGAFTAVRQLHRGKLDSQHTGSQRLLNWLPPSREKPPGGGYRWLLERSLGQLLKGCANINRPLMHWTELNWT